MQWWTATKFRVLSVSHKTLLSDANHAGQAGGGGTDGSGSRQGRFLAALKLVPVQVGQDQVGPAHIGGVEDGPEQDGSLQGDSFQRMANKPQRGNPRCTWIASSTARSPALERTPTWLLSRVLSAAMI